jgi:hypothetical protein
MASGALSPRQVLAVLFVILLFGALIRLLLVSMPSECPVSFWGGEDTLLCHDVSGGGYELDL